MKKLLVLVLFMVGCSPDKQVVEIVNGKDGLNGTSCTVSDYALTNSEGVTQVLGALISCTDGSSATVLNGSDGADGAQGAAGPQGETGPQGAAGPAGEDGKSCMVQRGNSQNYVIVKCGDDEVVVNDGKDGKDGQDGADGEDGQDGTNAVNSMSITSITMSKDTCKQVGGTASAIRTGNSGEVKVYDTLNCTGAFISLNDGELTITQGGSLVLNVEGSDVLKMISFNGSN